MNYQKYYKATISNDQLRQAFLSWQGISDLIAKIVDAMYTGANYDEFQTMKYMLARHILDGHMYPVEIPTVETANMKSIVSVVKGVSNKFTFLSTNYNLAGVQTYTAKNDQYMLINSQFDATMDVEVLASAFNMDKAEFAGKRVATTIVGHSVYEGGGDRDKCLEIIEKCTDKLDLTIYDYFQRKKDGEKYEYFKYVRSFAHKDKEKYKELLAGEREEFKKRYLL